MPGGLNKLSYASKAIRFTHLWNMDIFVHIFSLLSVATHLRKFYFIFCQKFAAESIGERFLKIGEHLAKLEPKI